jgi:hypothetical protein
MGASNVRPPVAGAGAGTGAGAADVMSPSAIVCCCWGWGVCQSDHHLDVESGSSASGYCERVSYQRSVGRTYTRVCVCVCDEIEARSRIDVKLTSLSDCRFDRPQPHPHA